MDTSKLMQTLVKDAGVNVSEATLFTDSLGEKMVVVAPIRLC